MKQFSKQFTVFFILLSLLTGGIALSSTSITEILGGDTISSSRTVINNNFNSLNANKIENSSTFTVATSTGMVGVGTTSPATTLSVTGTTTNDGAMIVNGTFRATNASTTNLSITALKT